MSKFSEHFVRDRKQELHALGIMLSQENLIRDPQPFFDVECGPAGAEGKTPLWSCTLESVQFVETDVQKEKIKHTRPAHIRTVGVELSVRFVGRCLDKTALGDPFRDLSVQGLVSGHGNGPEPWLCAWHVDRHIRGEEDADDADDDVEDESGIPRGTPRFVHPDYHFQYGGEGVWGLTDEQYGRHLLLEAPRLAHPPLDAVLAIDFVLSNYYGRRWHDLRHDPAYRRMIRSAHDRIWRPYSIATASNWIGGSAEWDATLLWPHLLPTDAEVLRERADRERAEAAPAKASERRRKRRK